MIRFLCPTCQKRLKAPDDGAGRKTSCPRCGQRMLVPAPPPPPASINKTLMGQLASSPAPGSIPPADVESDSLVLLGLTKHDEVDDDNEHELGDTKYCHECGRKIRARAEICPKCGVRQHDLPVKMSRSSAWRSGIKVPVLISAISNIVVGLIWLSTCFGFVFTIPMVILCIFEFVL